MAPAVLAGLVREQSPDHAPHTQEYIRTTASSAEGDTIEVSCSCRVGLTLKVPRTPAPGEVLAHFTVKKDGSVVDHMPDKKGKVSDGA